MGFGCAGFLEERVLRVWYGWECELARLTSDSTKRVPTQTALAPRVIAAAKLWPLNRPPAATTWTSLPMPPFLPLHIAATVGMSTVVGTSPV